MLTVRNGESTQRSVIKHAFIVIEVAMSLILLVGSGLLFRSFLRLSAVQPGFQIERMLTFKAQPPQSVLRESPEEGSDVKPGLERYYRELETAIAEFAGVEAVGTVFPTPLSGEHSASTFTNDVNAGDEETQLASSQLVTSDYFQVADIPMLQGRTFRDGDGGDRVVVDQNLAQLLWSDENPLGQRIRVGWWSGPKWAEVIGVVGNARTHELSEPNPPTLYRLAAVYAYSAQTFIVRTAGNPNAIVSDVRQILAQRYPTAPMTEVQTLENLAAEQAAPMRFVLMLIGVFAGIALVLAAVGMYGVISYVVSRRTREIGVRLAFGARTSQIFKLIMQQALGLAVLGVVIGLAGAAGLSRLLSSYLYEVTPTDPITFIVISALLVGVAAMACCVPALRAIRVDPVRSLRIE